MPEFENGADAIMPPNPCQNRMLFAIEMPRYRTCDVLMGQVTLQPTQHAYLKRLRMNDGKSSSYTLTMYKIMFVDALFGA